EQRLLELIDDHHARRAGVRVGLERDLERGERGGAGAERLADLPVRMRGAQGGDEAGADQARLAGARAADDDGDRLALDVADEGRGRGAPAVEQRRVLLL